MGVRGGVRRSSVVVGRGVELDTLRAYLRGVAAGAGACVFLTGEGGVGKSRLLGETVHEARRRGIPTLVGRASPTSPVSFGVVAEAVRSWVRTQRADSHEPSLFDPGLRLILPEWPANDAQAGLSDSQLRLLALEGLVELARRIAADRGALVALDDMHESDAESLDAVRYLAGAGVDGLVIVAAARRDENVVCDHLVDNLIRQGVAVGSPVEPLESHDVGDLLRALIGSTPPLDLVQDVVDRTDGVPLLVEEVVDAHLRAGSLTLDDDGAHWRGGVQVVPRSVAAMVSGRLDRLPTDQRDVIIAGSVVGLPDSELLAAVAVQPPDTVRAAIAAAVDAGLAESIAGKLEFRHAVIGDAVREHASPDAIRAAHGRAATALSAIVAPDAAVFERIAGHRQAVGDADGAAGALVEAAQRARAAHVLLNAEALARRAGDMATTTATADMAADALADALTAQGRWSDALVVDEQTVARSGQTPARWMRMVRCALDGRHFDAARELAAHHEVAKDASPYVDVAIGRVALLDGDPARALARAADALKSADGDALSICGALDLRARASEFAEKRDEAAQAWTEQAAVAERAGLTAERLRALVSLAELELFAGDPPVRMTEVVDVARKSGAIVEHAWAQFNLSIALSNQGHVADAHRVAQAAADLCRQHRLDLLPFALLSVAATSSFLGNPAFEDDLAEARRLGGDAGDVTLHAGSILAEHRIMAGRYDDAIPSLEQALTAVAAAPGSLPTSAPFWLPLVLAAAGRTEAAREALQRAREVPNPSRWPSLRTILAVGEAALAGDDEAVDAALASGPARMPLDAALLRIVAADVVDTPVRVKWLREALDILESHSVVLGVDRVRGLLRDAGAPVPRRRRRDLVPPELIRRGVTAREAEVLALVRDGMSNAAIAEKLFLSVRTVESHVSALLTKLGVSSRAELSA